MLLAACLGGLQSRETSLTPAVTVGEAPLLLRAALKNNTSSYLHACGCLLLQLPVLMS